MNRRLLSASMVMAASMLATLPALAAPHTHGDAKQLKVKQVSLTLRNDSKVTIKVMAGATEFSIEPGKSTQAKLNPGDKVVSEDATATVAAGTLLAVVDASMNSATIAIR